MKKIVLASSSIYRRQLLDTLQLPYQCSSPEIDESIADREDISHLVTRLAYEKCLAIAPQHPDSLIIGSDQAACIADTILNKPLCAEKAQQQLRLCSGNTVTFHTGLCLFDTQDNSYQSKDVLFNVHFRQLSDSEIARYIALEQPLNCAGSFKVEGLGISLFSRLEGDDHNSLIGLPLIELLNMLSAKGISPLTA